MESAEARDPAPARSRLSQLLADARSELAGSPEGHQGLTRGRTAILNQLLLCAIVLIASNVLLFTRDTTNGGLFLAGVLVIFAGGIVAFAVPWRRVARGWIILLPLADLVAIALLRVAEPNGGLGLLWAFPAMWMATLGIVAYIAQLVLIIGGYWMIIALSPFPVFSYSALLLPLLIVAISTTSLVGSRRFAAQQRLLDAQATVLTAALSRSHRQEQLLTEVFDAVDFGVIRIAPDGSVSVVNEALGRFQRIIPGFGDVEVGLTNAFESDGTTPLSEADRPLVRAVRGEIFDNQIVWFGPVEGPRWAMSMTSRHLRDSDGQDAGSVLIVRDVTAEMTALKARDRLVASVSHELRTPLTSVLGYIDLAEDHLDRPDLARKDLEVAAKNGERLLEIVSDILAASSSSRFSADMTISPEDMDIAELVLSASEAWQARAAEQAVTVSASGVEPARAFADPLRIRQVVDNLVSNAVKYNRDGGEVTLGTTSDGTDTWILVRDNGVGISEADQVRLFERFFRARPTVEGTGLGLSISRDIVRAHHGELTVNSAPGVGSTFIVKLPATAAAAQGAGEGGDT